MIQEIIKKQLKVIENEYQIKILYACESGSRAWGFPSPNSDFDVRFIYLKSFNSYLSLDEQSSQLSFPINDDLDINGWDIKKTLQLIQKSNTTPFEWLQSPIIYQQDEVFRTGLWNLCQYYFNPRGNIFHYLGIAKSALNSMNNSQQIGIKKLFYVLRPLMCADWCLNKNSIAPMTIQELMPLLPNTLVTQVNDFIAFKSTVAESYLIAIDQEIKDYIENSLSTMKEKTTTMENKHFDFTKLNTFFFNLLNK